MTDDERAAMLAHVHAIADYLAAVRRAHHGTVEDQQVAVELWHGLSSRARDAVAECAPLPEWLR